MERTVKALLVVLGLGQLGLGVWQAATPSNFFNVLGRFGPQNDHYVRDVSTFYVALSVGLLVAASRPSWRVPVLFLAVLEYSLHTVNHVVDAGKGHPGWVGPFDALSLAEVAGLLALVLWMVKMEESI